MIFFFTLKIIVLILFIKKNGGLVLVDADWDVNRGNILKDISKKFWNFYCCLGRLFSEVVGLLEIRD